MPTFWDIISIVVLAWVAHASVKTGFFVLGHIFRKKGNYKKALWCFKWLHRLTIGKSAAILLATAHINLGEFDQTFRYIEKFSKTRWGMKHLDLLSKYCSVCGNIALDNYDFHHAQKFFELYYLLRDQQGREKTRKEGGNGS